MTHAEPHAPTRPNTLSCQKKTASNYPDQLARVGDEGDDTQSGLILLALNASLIIKMFFFFFFGFFKPDPRKEDRSS
jgi:hypothetical protein